MSKQNSTFFGFFKIKNDEDIQNWILFKFFQWGTFILTGWPILTVYINQYMIFKSAKIFGLSFTIFELEGLNYKILTVHIYSVMTFFFLKFKFLTYKQTYNLLYMWVTHSFFCSWHHGSKPFIKKLFNLNRTGPPHQHFPTGI